MLGKLVHYTADAVLVSAMLAGIKRSTGLTLAVDKIESQEVRNVVVKVLNVGEWVFDQTVLLMNLSSYFERRR
ncbi:DUF1748-domain-containing protein [Basidiobolus meristosporus CBS 931.73]|uniref:DUF1748-domain-containing protein n=1 Tax=Basidiobolus meristosporus CBS 931.73 TaxID=1314790 RepID=A0A1Y1Z9J8_9FUNG|nr:DUF1748-domain-containing protein [Basidiobolus meristosporus CBS 931.73]|eukprot:ORY06942.1 DUF1748-domain-containing protein [Basidiobolus meristosporus CBS 931.73]